MLECLIFIDRKKEKKVPETEVDLASSTCSALNIHCVADLLYIYLNEYLNLNQSVNIPTYKNIE